MKSTILSVVFSLALIAGAYVLTKENSGVQDTNQNNVTIVDGRQIVEIRAKGGYLPRKSVAKVGIPTVLRFNTSGTFDCSSSVRIPSMNISKLLPQSGVTDIDIGSSVARTLVGSCGMGMYPFEIEFKS